MGYIIRKANYADLDSVLELWVELFEAVHEIHEVYADNLTEKAKEERKDYYRQVLISDNDIVLLAEIAGNVVGFVEACLNDKDFSFHLEEYVYIPYYYVKKEYRKNIKMMLNMFKEVERWTKANGRRYLCSDVDGKNSNSLRLQEKFFSMKVFKSRLFKEIL
jgi:hypothetical protein